LSLNFKSLASELSGISAKIFSGICLLNSSTLDLYNNKFSTNLVKARVGYICLFNFFLITVLVQLLSALETLLIIEEKVAKKKFLNSIPILNSEILFFIKANSKVISLLNQLS